MTRTVITPSSMAREVVRTTIDSDSQAVDVITYTCATAETSNSPTDSSTQVHAQSGSGSGDLRWRLGAPYFRNDGPNAGSMMPPTNVPEQRSEQPYPLQYMTGPHMTGQYGPMGSILQQEDYVNQYNQELLRQYRGGVMMTNTVPIMGVPSPTLSGRGSPYVQPRSPLANCTPMADAEYTGRAQLPTNYQMNMQQGPYPAEVQTKATGFLTTPHHWLNPNRKER